MAFLKRLLFLLCVFVLGSLLKATAQKGSLDALFKQHQNLFTTPKSYVVQHTSQIPFIDGDITDEVWQKAHWTDLFVDIEGDRKSAPLYQTKVKMLWSDSALFIAAYLQEPHVWATLKSHDAIVYHDNDFEVFIDPDNNTHHYFEIEVNAYNTILDLLMPKPYRNGANALIGYDVAHLKTAVQVRGTLNNSGDKDSSWTVEMAIPFKSLYMGNYWQPPAEGALWRINFSRVQWQTDVVNGQYDKKRNEKGAVLPENNWVWSPQGVVNMHYPERWGYLLFTKKENTVFTLPYDEKRKRFLWLLYYQQKAYQARHGRYASSLVQLNITSTECNIDSAVNKLKLEATSRQFMVYITDSNATITLNQEGFVQKINARL